MPTPQYIINQLSEITERINNIERNSKRTQDFESAETPLKGSELIRLVDSSVPKKTTVTDLINYLRSFIEEDINSKADRGDTFGGSLSDLKDLIDQINIILTSDDTSLDELQEIVSFIKQNKTELENLSSNNIAGLSDVLEGKEDKLNKQSDITSDDPEHYPNVQAVNEGLKSFGLKKEETFRSVQFYSGTSPNGGISNPDILLPSSVNGNTISLLSSLQDSLSQDSKFSLLSLQQGVYLVSFLITGGQYFRYEIDSSNLLLSDGYYNFQNVKLVVDENTPIGANTGANINLINSISTTLISTDLTSKTDTGGSTLSTQDLKDEIDALSFEGALTYTSVSQLNAERPNPSEFETAIVNNRSISDDNGKYSVVNGTWTKYRSLVENEIDINNTTEAVSGFAVADELRKIHETLDSFGNVTREIPFTLDNGEVVGSTGRGNSSLNWINSGLIDVVEGEIYTISVPRIGANWGLTKAKRVTFVDSEGVGIGVLDSGEAEIYTFTVPLGAVQMNIQIDAGSNVGADLSSVNPYNQTFKIFEGNSTETYIDSYLLRGDIETEQMKSIESFVDSLKNQSEVIKETQNYAVATGALRKTNSVSNDSDYFRTSITNLSAMYRFGGNVLRYTGDIRNAEYAGVLYFSEDGSFLGFEAGEIGVYDNFLLSPPQGTIYVGCCSFGSRPLVEEEFIELEITAQKTYYVDSSASENGEGTDRSPFASIGEAVLACLPNAKNEIFLKEGDYREQLEFRGLGNLSIEFTGEVGKRIRVLGSEKIDNWILHSGNVYRADFSGVFHNYSRYDKPIFEDGNHSKPIEENERHPLQKNLSFRLPYSVITPVSSIQEVQDNQGSYFYDEANEVIYLHSSDSSSVLTNGFSYEIPQRRINTNNSADYTGRTNLSFRNIQFFYGTNGLSLRGFGYIERRNCSIFAMGGAGGFIDDSCDFIQSWFDESAGNDNDGINGHFGVYTGFRDLTDHRSMQPTAIYNDFWTHDNLDDGMSHHENHNVRISGGLSEYNEDGGIRASNDANYTIYNYWGRKNGLSLTVNDGGEGIGAVNPNVNENRLGCSVVAYNCVLEGNNKGAGILTQSDNQITLIDCSIRNNRIDLYARRGKIFSRNTKHSNSVDGVAKLTEDDGEIVVINDSLLV